MKHTHESYTKLLLIPVAVCHKRTSDRITPCYGQACAHNQKPCGASFIQRLGDKNSTQLNIDSRGSMREYAQYLGHSKETYKPHKVG